MFHSLFLLSSVLLSGELYNPQQSFPSLSGSTGLLRSTSALPEEEGQFGAIAAGSFFFENSFIDANKHSRNRLRLAGNYQLPWNLQVYTGFQFTFNESSSSANSRSATSFFENLDAGLKWSMPVYQDVIYLGASVTGRFFSGSRQLRNVSGYVNEKTGPFAQGIAELLATFDLRGPIELFPLLAHVNVGYRSPNGNRSLPVSSPANDRSQQVDLFNLDQNKYQSIIYAAALEFPFRYVNPFIEASGEYAILTGNDSVSFSDNRQKLSFGVQGIPHPVVNLFAAVDIGFGGDTKGSNIAIPQNPPWQAHFGLAFSTNAKKLFGEIADLQGQVVDQETGLALPDVSVRILGATGLPQSTDTGGFYQIRNIPAGEYQVEFTKEGYRVRTETLRLRGGRLNNLDATLERPGPPRGNLFIEIVDATTGEAVSRAFVELSGVEKALITDQEGRVLATEIPAGLRNMRIEAPGYEPRDYPVEIFDGEQIEQRFSLQREGPRTGEVFGSVVNEEGSGLTAVFTSVDGAISPFGTDPLTGRFRHSLPAGFYQLKVQAQNYLPEDFELEIVAGSEQSMDIVLKKPEQAVVVDDQIILPQAIYFAVNSADIDLQSTSVLDQVAQVLRDNLEAFKIVRIEGHTDSDGSEAYNKDLSERRARSIRQYLIEAGIPPEKMEAYGFGLSRPIATNLTDAGKAENRRVEFNLVRE